MSSDSEPASLPDGLLLSVRGDAIETVDPDFGELHLSLTVVAANKADASIDAGRRLDMLLAELEALGGVTRSPESLREPLTWMTMSVGCHPELGVDPTTGGKGFTGTWFADAQLVLRVRDFQLLEPLQALLDGHDVLTVQFASWHVDPTNPAWSRVREAAIHDAIRRGRDYATALGGRLARIQHIADVGLLGGNEQARTAVFATSGRRMLASGGPNAPRLDPVPQDLTAVIEARFSATSAPLDTLSCPG